MADRLSLTARELTALVGGLCALGVGGSSCLTRKVGTLSKNFFVNLLDDSIEWKAIDKSGSIYQGLGRKTQRVVWSGANSILRDLAETYALADSHERFARDFASAFAKVMELDRFDIVGKSVSRL